MKGLEAIPSMQIRLAPMDGWGAPYSLHVGPVRYRVRLNAAGGLVITLQDAWGNTVRLRVPPQEVPRLLDLIHVTGT